MPDKLQTKWYVELLLRHRVLLLALTVALTALAVEPALRLKFDPTVAGMFRESDPRLLNYRESKEVFGGVETAVVAYTDKHLFANDGSGIRRVGRLADELKQVPGVATALSLAQARLPSKPLDSRPLAAQLEDRTVTSEQLRKELLASKLYVGTLLGPDAQTAAVIVQLDPAKDPAVAVQGVRRIAAAHHPPAIVAGEPVLVQEAYRYLEEDGRRLGIASSVILTLVLGLLFRNLRWIVLPLLVVHITILWTKALLVLSDMRLTMVSSPLVALVTVIGVATVVHITMRFRDERNTCGPIEAVRRAMINIGPAIFYTSLTTAGGFGVLVASDVTPVQSFGVMMAIGSMLVFVVPVLLMPGGVLLGRYDPSPAPSSEPPGPSNNEGFVGRHLLNDPGVAPGEGRLGARLLDIVMAVERRPWLVAGGTISLLALAVLGCFRLQVATDFSENYRKDSPIVKAYDFVSEHLGSVGSFDVLINLPPADTDLPSQQFLDQVQALQDRLASVTGVVKSISLVDLLNFLKSGDERPKGLAGLTATAFGLLPLRTRLELMSKLEPAFVSAFWNRDQQIVRIVLQVGERKGSAAKRELIETAERFAQEQFPGTNPQGKPRARVAGAYILLNYLVDSLLENQWVTFVLALVAIFVMMWRAFRSWQLGIVALVPNAIPILIVVGAMGWIGLPINIATAMISCVSMGLAVDCSIHYLYRFQQERAAGAGFYDALRAVHASVGRAMVLANVALVSGFSVLVLSNLIPTVHFGILVSVAMLGGLAGNLIILPLLMTLIPSVKRDTPPPTAPPARDRIPEPVA